MITDAERTNAAAVLEDCYRHHGIPGAAHRDTMVDPLGYAAHLEVYYAARGRGSDHATAVTLMHDRIHVIAFPPTPPTPPVPGSHPNPLVGRLRIVNGMLVDDTGAVLPLFAHAGDLFSLFTRDRPRAHQQLDVVAAEGYHGVRSWFNLRGPYWAGREIGPDITTDYWGEARAFLQALAVRQLRLIWSQGDQVLPTMTERENYAISIAYVLLRAASPQPPHVVAFLDAGNEAWQTDPWRLYDDPQNMARFLRAYQDAGGTALLTTTSPPGETHQEMVDYAIPPSHLYDIHGFRGDHSWDKRRHIFSVAYEGHPPLPLGIQSEPAGGGFHVSASANKEEMDDEAVGCLAAMSLIARQAFVWFSGEGVKIQLGLETEPGFASCPRIARMLPRDVMRPGTLHHSGQTWHSIRVFSLGSTHPDVRCDGVLHPDGTFAYVLDGPTGVHRIYVERPCDVTIIHPGTGEAHAFSMVAGPWDVSWVRGRVLIGKVR